MTELKGELFGVRLVDRGENDPHTLIQIISEDDGTWFEYGGSFSHHWLGDLIRVLTEAQTVLQLHQGPSA